MGSIVGDSPPTQGARRFLLAAGTASYESAPDAPLAGVPSDVDAVVDLFTRKLGYQRVLLDEGGDDIDLTVGDIRRGFEPVVAFRRQVAQ